MGFEKSKTKCQVKNYSNSNNINKKKIENKGNRINSEKSENGIGNTPSTSKKRSKSKQQMDGSLKKSLKTSSSIQQPTQSTPNKNISDLTKTSNYKNFNITPIYRLDNNAKIVLDKNLLEMEKGGRVSKNLDNILNTLKMEYDKLEMFRNFVSPALHNIQNPVMLLNNKQIGPIQMDKKPDGAVNLDEFIRFAKNGSSTPQKIINHSLDENVNIFKERIPEVIKNKPFPDINKGVNKINNVFDDFKPALNNEIPKVINKPLELPPYKNINSRREICEKTYGELPRMKSSSSSRSSSGERFKKPIFPRPQIQTSFINSEDKIKIFRDEVNAAIKYRKIFAINSNWYSIRRALNSRGWIEKFQAGSVPVQTDPNLIRRLEFLSIPELLKSTNDKDGIVYKQMILSKMIGNATPVSLHWDLPKPLYHQNPDIYKNTMLNFIPKTRFSYANKQGLAHFSKQAHWYEHPGFSQLKTPRSFSLISTEDPEEFIYDFKVTAAVSLLKWIINTHESNVSKLISDSGRVPIAFFHFALQECIRFIKIHNHEDIDKKLEQASEKAWEEFLDNFYMAVHVGNHFKNTYEESEVSLVHKSKTMLKKIKEVSPYVEMDGFMNIWILKPSCGSRGIGIHFCRTLRYVLKVIKEKKNCSYVVQKYIERPLLIYNTKFDIRQWFLISSTTPLTVWIYKECYLRFSSQTYNLRKLHESIHLTNNSVQSKYHNGNRDPGLPPHNMWFLQQFKEHLTNIGYPNVYNDIIFPGMKECVKGALLASSDSIVPRAKSFELHGADFMITENFQPWLIEINSKPALHASTAVTSKLCPIVLEDVIKVVVDYARDCKSSTGNFELLYKEDVLPPLLVVNHQKLRVEGKPLPPDYFLTEDQESKLTSEPEKSQTSIQSFNIIQKSDYMKYVGKEMKNALKQLMSLIQKEKQRRKNKKAITNLGELQGFAYSDEIQQIKSSISTIEEIFKISNIGGSSKTSLHVDNNFSKESFDASIDAFSKMLVKASDSKLKTNCVKIEKALNCNQDNKVVNNVISIFEGLASH